MKWGPEVDRVEDLIAESGKAPPGYLDRPAVEPESEFAWDAFWALSSDRASGFGEGPIPFTAIESFARRYRIDDLDEFDDLASMVRALDGEYLRMREKQQAAERDRDKRPVSRRPSDDED